MDIFADSVGVDDKENENLRNKQPLTYEGMYGRTPLRDRKNDTELFLSQITSSSKCGKTASLASKYEASNLSAPSTPKRKQRNLKARRSCIPSFRDDFMFSSEEMVTGITLPEMSEEEPDVYTQIELTTGHGHGITQEGHCTHKSSASVVPILHNHSIYSADQKDSAGELTVLDRAGQENIIQRGEPGSSSDDLKLSEKEVSPESNCSAIDETCDPNTGFYAIHFTKNRPDVLIHVTKGGSTDLMDNVTTDHTYAVAVQQSYNLSPGDVSLSCQISSHTVSDHCLHSFHAMPPSTAFIEIPDDADLESGDYSHLIETCSNNDESYFEELSESAIERLLEVEHTPGMSNHEDLHHSPRVSNHEDLHHSLKMSNHEDLQHSPRMSSHEDLQHSPIIFNHEDLNHPPRMSNHEDLQHSSTHNELNNDHATAAVLIDEPAEETRSQPSVSFNRQLMQSDNPTANTLQWDSMAPDNCCLSQEFVNSPTESPPPDTEAWDILCQDDLTTHTNLALSQSLISQTTHTDLALNESFSPQTQGDDMMSLGKSLVRESQHINNHRSSSVAMVTNEYTVSNTAVSPEHSEMVENLDRAIMVDGSCQVDFVLNTEIVDTIDLSKMAVPLLVNTSALTEPCHVTDFSMITDRTDTLDHSMMAMPDVINKLTMTDKKLVTDSGSSMTPVKVTNKGQRLTAETVRQLHPRTLANQLDTLMSLNQRLEKEVKSSAQEIVHLKAGLKAAKSKLLDVEQQLEAEKLGQDKHITMLEELHEEATLGLQACIQEKQATIYNLEQELTCAKEKRKEAEVRLMTLEQQFAGQIENLQQLEAEAKCHLEAELVKLRTRYDENNCKRKLESSLQIIQELQAEKHEFMEVFDDLERNLTLQFHLADRLILLERKVKGSTWKDRQEHEQLVSEFYQMKKKFEAHQKELDSTLSENKELQLDIKNLSDILNRSNKCLVELEAMYKNVNDELKESQEKVSYYSSELMARTQALEELTEEQEVLTQQMMAVQESRDKLSQALVQAEKKVLKLEQEHIEQKQLFDVSKQIEHKKRADDESSKSKLEQHIENLLHTLDSLEVKKELTEQELYELREQMFSDRIKMEDMAVELDMLHKVKATYETEKEQVEELRHTIKLLEAEKELCMEAIGDLRSKLEAEEDSHRNNKRLVDSLLDNNSKLQGSYQSLMSKAHKLDQMLSLKMVDIEASSTSLRSLEDKMDVMLNKLQEKLALEFTCKTNTKNNNVTHWKPNLSFQHGDSHEAVILSHVIHSPGNTSNGWESGGNKSQQESRNRAKQCNVACYDLEPCVREYSPHAPTSGGREENDIKSNELGYPWDISGLDFTFSSVKTSARISGSEKLNESSERLSSSTPRFASIRRIPTTVDRAKDVRKHDQFSTVVKQETDCEGFDSLLAKVKSIERKFSLIEKATDNAERTSEMTINDLKAEMDILSSKVQSQKNQIAVLESDLAQKTHLLNVKNTEVKDLNTRVKAMNESILNFHDQKLENKRLENDKKELQHRVEDLRGQVSLLTEQLEDFIKKLSYSREPDIVSAREILALKKKNHDGIMKLFMEREKNQELGEKAVKRMKILESNWQKAEAEVKKLDDLLESVRQACIDSQCQSKVPVVLHIIRLLDGLV